MEVATIRTTRTGFLALAVAFSAGIKAALVPEHLEELPPLGYAFILAAVIGGALAWALVSRPHDRRLSLLAGLFLAGQMGAWALFVTVPVPGFAGTPEPVETIALVSKAAEALGVLLALSLITSPALGRPRRSAGQRDQLGQGGLAADNEIDALGEDLAERSIRVAVGATLPE